MVKSQPGHCKEPSEGTCRAVLRMVAKAPTGRYIVKFVCVINIVC